MNIDKYNLVKDKVENDDNYFSQSFIDKDKKVRYTRISWKGEFLEDSTKDLILSTSNLIKSILPNCIKIESEGNITEVLGVEDDDIEFRSNSELKPLVEKSMKDNMEKVLSECDSNIEPSEFVSKLLDRIFNNEEVINKLKDIYSKYKDIEL